MASKLTFYANFWKHLATAKIDLELDTIKVALVTSDYVPDATMPDGRGHAWLVVQTEKKDLALDINYREVVPAGAMNYSGRMRQTGTSWGKPGVLLSDVPVEYMKGLNAGAFLVNDRVVVAFTGQDWNSPKVIGFEDHPRPGDIMYSWRRAPDYWTVIIERWSLNGAVIDELARVSTGIYGWGDLAALGVNKKDREVVFCIQDHEAYIVAMVFDSVTKAVKRTLTLDIWLPYSGQVTSRTDFHPEILSSVTFDPWGNLCLLSQWYTGDLVRWFRSGIYKFSSLTGGAPIAYRVNWGSRWSQGSWTPPNPG